MALAQSKQLVPFGQRHYRTGRVAGRAGVDQLRAGPDRFGHAVPVDREVARRVAGHKVRFGAGQQRRAFVDLVERIRADHVRRLGRRACIDHGLRQRKQRFARTIDRQHLGRRVQRKTVAALDPAGEGRTQRRLTGGRRVAGKATQVVAQCLLDEIRRRMLGLANAQADGGVGRVRRDAGEQLSQPLERVGLQAR